MTGPISRFDHAMIAVADLERAAALWKSLGFRLTPKGVHQGKGTANYCLMFADSYIELIGVVNPQEASGRLAARIAQAGEGVAGLAYGSDDADKTHGALIAAGVKAEAPVSLERPLELDGDREMVRFRNIMLPEAGLEPVLQLVCSHLTPGLTRARHEWQLHANGVTGVNEIVVCVSDPMAHADQLRRVFGKPAVRDRKGEVTALVEPMTLRLSKFEAIAERFPKAKLTPPQVLPHVVAICLDVNEPDAATTMWDMARIPYHEAPNGAVYTAASGVVLELSEG
jgi:catechol 2,3-dioxygenase-like lactoylglutathione lyase family enzyme